MFSWVFMFFRGFWYYLLSFLSSKVLDASFDAALVDLLCLSNVATIVTYHFIFFCRCNNKNFGSS